MLNKSKVITIGLGVTVMAGALFSFTKREGEGDEKKKMYYVIHQHDGELMEYDTVLPMSSAYSVENFLADKGINDENVEIIKVPSTGNHFMFKGEREEGKHVMIKEMNQTMVIDGMGESESVMIQVEIDDEGNKVIKKTVNGEEVEVTEEELEKMEILHKEDGNHMIIDLKSDGMEFDAEDRERIEISVEMDDEGNKVIKKTVNGVEVKMTEEEFEKMEFKSDRLHKGHHEQRMVVDHFDDSDRTEEEKAELMEKLKKEMNHMVIELDGLGEGMEFETIIEEIHEMEDENGDVQIMIRKMDGAGTEIEWISDGEHESDGYRMRTIHTEEEDFTIVIVTENLSDASVESPDQVKREMGNENDMVIFPNPNKGVFTIQFDQQEKQKTTIEVIGAQGKVVFEDNLGRFSGEYKKEIDLKNNGAGIYIIKVQQGNNLVSNKVIVD